MWLVLVGETGGSLFEVQANLVALVTFSCEVMVLQDRSKTNSALPPIASVIT